MRPPTAANSVLAGALDIPVSPDGTSLYLTANSDDSISTFARNISIRRADLQRLPRRVRRLERPERRPSGPRQPRSRWRSARTARLWSSRRTSTTPGVFARDRRPLELHRWLVGLQRRRRRHDIAASSSTPAPIQRRRRSASGAPGLASPAGRPSAAAAASPGAGRGRRSGRLSRAGSAPPRAGSENPCWSTMSTSSASVIASLRRRVGVRLAVPQQDARRPLEDPSRPGDAEGEPDEEVVGDEQRGGADHAAGDRVVVADQRVLQGVRGEQQDRQVEHVELAELALAAQPQRDARKRKTSSDRRIFSSTPRWRLKMPWSSEASGTIRPEFAVAPREPGGSRTGWCPCSCAGRPAVIAIRSPDSAMPCSRASVAQSSSSLRIAGPVLGLGRADPEEQVHPADRLEPAGRRRAPGPAGGGRRSAAPCAPSSSGRRSPSARAGSRRRRRPGRRSRRCRARFSSTRVKTISP